MENKKNLSQNQENKNQIFYQNVKHSIRVRKNEKTNIVEMFKFIKENKEMDWRGFYWWLKENDFQQMNHVWNKFNDGDVWHHEIFENPEFRIDMKYLEKKEGIIKFLNADIKRIVTMSISEEVKNEKVKQLQEK